jgi:hypothetical protein
LGLSSLYEEGEEFGDEIEITVRPSTIVSALYKFL